MRVIGCHAPAGSTRGGDHGPAATSTVALLPDFRCPPAGTGVLVATVSVRGRKMVKLVPDSAVLLATLTPNATRAERRVISLKAVFIATLIVLVFALFGQPILNQLGVSLPALQVAGGIILLMIALEMTLSK
ncbi:MAG: MarC family protein, partial [Pirellulales bacterium]